MSRLAIVCVPDQASLNNMAKSLVSSALSFGATTDVFNSDLDPSVIARIPGSQRFNLYTAKRKYSSVTFL